jgi:hypothetical protein
MAQLIIVHPIQSPHMRMIHRHFAQSRRLRRPQGEIALINQHCSKEFMRYAF